MDPIRRIQSQSAILDQYLTRHPNWATRLRHDPWHTKPKPRETLAHECMDWCAHAQNVEQGLRQFKYYELARMAWRDWVEHVAVEDLLNDWSGVAAVAVAAAWNHIVPAQHGDALTLLACGKLGADELNISSDIDLILLYDDGDDDTISTFAEKMVHDLTPLLQRPTADGFVFRVDWELRPEGIQGPAALSCNAAADYYESRGTEWERMMMIRARPIAGNLTLGHTFLTQMQPFIYRRHTEPSILNDLRQLKERIEREPSGDGINVKLGRGGIREIEFVTHAMQLLHGGKAPELQTHSTYHALRALIQHRCIPRSRGTALLEGYDCLRRIENMLQIDHDRQLHILPTEDAALHTLSARCQGALEKLPRHQERVHDAFRLIFAVPYEKIEILEAVESNLHTCTTIEERVDGLTWSKRSRIQKILADDIATTKTYPETCRHLTLLAEVIVEEIVTIATEQCQQRHGTPRDEHGRPVPFAVLALGSCGAFEMDYHSDLDVLFVYRGAGQTNGTHPIGHAEYFAKLGQKILSFLSLCHRYGRLYAVDADLRPSGHFGVLVSSEDAFFRYHRDEAQLWERQSMLRARVIGGDATYIAALSDKIQGLPFIANQPRDANQRIAELRLRIEKERAQETDTQWDLKFGPGGFADIEFLVQSLQLMHGQDNPALRQGNTWRAIEGCAQGGHLASDLAEQLTTAYTMLRRVVGHYRLATNSVTTRIDTTSHIFQEVVGVLQLGTDDDAAAHITHTRAIVRHYFNQLFHL